jgi:uncharacterized repeat protein (TIGR03803 family)
VLYGTTIGGGRNQQGTVSKITTSGAESVLHSFAGRSDDGAAPSSEDGPLTVDTPDLGRPIEDAVDVGQIRITKAGEENTIYRFAGGSDGLGPSGALAYVNGVLYGTTLKGGANNAWTVFSLSL